MAKLIGTDPNQVPTNGDLGDLAYQDYDVVAPELKGGRRNLIINGAMQIWQRGTSFSVGTANSFDYFADRWTCFKDTDQGSGSVTLDYTRSTDSPNGEFDHSLKCVVTPNSFSPSGSDNLALFVHKIESYHARGLAWGTSDAKPATLSFWIKASEAGTGTLQVRLQDSSSVSGAADGNLYTTFTVDAANTWQKVIVNIPKNTQDSWQKDASTSAIMIHWYFGSVQGTVGTTDAWFRTNNHGHPHPDNTYNWMTDGGTAYITGVQLEVGSVATPFEHRSYGEELALCQRYYYRYGGGSGYGVGYWYQGTQRDTTTTEMKASHPVVMRTAPTFSGSGTWQVGFWGSGATVSSWSTNTTGNHDMNITASHGSGGASGRAVEVYGNTSTSIHEFDAEL